MHDAIDASQRGAAPQRSGNNDKRWFRQDLWPAAGNDRWIAISLRDLREWQVLCELARGEDIAAWTRSQTDAALMQQLQQRGIAAGVVQDIEDTVEHDAVLAARGALVQLPHRRLGAFGHVRTPMDFSAGPLAPFRAPEIGEHNEEIARALGLDAQRIAALTALGVFK
jgi:crotonobetainyl-CoA:carnitine CoA-transferase CaiB-like acyl-CoA transferase